MLRIGFDRCPYCHRADVYTSRPQGLWEELAVLLLLRPVRCHDCMHRSYRPIFKPSTGPLTPIKSVNAKRPPHQATEDKNTRRSA